MEKANLQIKRITLQEINFADNSYNLRPNGEDALPKDFIKSIQICGVLHPPILQVQSGAGYIILAGRRRLLASRDILELNRCTCFIVPEDASSRHCLELVLEEGLLSNTWSPVIKAIYIKKIVAIIGEEETIARILPRLGITPQKYHLEKNLALAEIEEPLALAIHKGHIAQKTAYKLSRLALRDRLALFDLISGLKLSVGNQRQVIDICEDLAKRASSSIHAVLSDATILEVLNQPGQNIPQQTAKLMKILQARRFPRLTAANQEFDDWQNSLKLPGWVEVSHAPSFETEKVSLQLNFSNKETLANFCQEKIN